MSSPRKQSSSGIYHIFTRGTGKQLIFEDDDDYRFFRSLLEGMTRANDVRLHAWCLMGNHIHLLASGEIAGISKCMRDLLATYARRFNEKTGRVGHLFQERFRSEAIEDDSRFLTALAYIHHNPVAAKIASLVDYEWSSYREYLGEPELCDTELALSMLDGVEGYRQLHEGFRGDAGMLDVDSFRSRTRSMPDSLALEIARDALGSLDLSELKGLEKGRRDAHLVRLKARGLSIKQIERLTGISRSVVQRASDRSGSNALST